MTGRIRYFLISDNLTSSILAVFDPSCNGGVSPILVGFGLYLPSLTK